MSEDENRLETALFSAVAKTIETIAFEEIELVDDSTGTEIAADMIWAALPLIRPYPGQLVLHITPEYVKNLAKVIYGDVDEATSDETIMDIISEVADTIAGRFMNELVPPDQAFELGLPTTGVGDFPEGFEEVSSILINVGEYPLVTSVSGSDFAEQLTTE